MAIGDRRYENVGTQKLQTLFPVPRSSSGRPVGDRLPPDSAHPGRRAHLSSSAESRNLPDCARGRLQGQGSREVGKARRDHAPDVAIRGDVASVHFMPRPGTRARLAFCHQGLDRQALRRHRQALVQNLARGRLPRHSRAEMA